MSFADRVREELCAIPVKHPCCRRAMTGALLLLSQPTGEKREFRIRLRSACAASFASLLLRQQFGKEPTCERYGSCGRIYYDLTFSSPAAARLIARFSEGTDSPEEILGFSCDACADLFLRGCFLFFGTVSDPKKSFHLEFLLPNEGMADLVEGLFSRLGLIVRRIHRSTGEGLYFKNGSAVEELITRMGAHHIVFDVINTRIEREIRNNENRATNCVAKNIEKSISASARQLEAIDRLREHGRFASLPEGVRTTAMLRYEHPDATLDELCAMHLPLISRSGLNHRLQKLLSEADEL